MATKIETNKTINAMDYKFNIGEKVVSNFHDNIVATVKDRNMADGLVGYTVEFEDGSIEWLTEDLLEKCNG